VHWTIGDVRITMVRELSLTLPFRALLTGHDPAVVEANRAWLFPHFVDETGNMHLSFHALVVESAGRTVLVDTCIGNRPIPGLPDISNMGDGFIEDLAAAGFPAESVDVVLCTHLHFDHVGWNTRLVDGQWVPTFPNARYLFSRVDYQYWDAGNEGYAFTFADAVRPVFAAGLADLVEMDHVIDERIRLEPTPGHSPGHVSVRISSRGEDAVITGDLLHHPVQFVAPHWAADADVDAALAEVTRTAFRDRYADSGVRIFGTHFGGPSAGHLRRSGGSFRFDA
jgi:glyoxylase-like metal-dependent hydrolase (beta-lactamase superfamily II)